MDGHYPDDMYQKSEPPAGQQQVSAQNAAPAQSPKFAPNRPPEDEDLYLPPSQRPKPKWRRVVGKIIKILMIVVLAVAVAGGAYFAFFHNRKSAETPAKTQQQPAKSSNAYTEKTKSVNSENVGLTLAYPESWSVNDTTEKLTITSPVTSLTDASGQQLSGKIVLTIRPKGTTPEAFDKGGVISALDSQKIKYTKPTPVQRGETYLTFVQNTEKLVDGQLDGIYVTGDFGYQANQFVPKTDIEKLDPLISVTFQKCDDDQCKNPADTSVHTDMWSQNEDFQKTITTMLTSIQVNE